MFEFLPVGRANEEDGEVVSFLFLKGFISSFKLAHIISDVNDVSDVKTNFFSISRRRATFKYKDVDYMIHVPRGTSGVFEIAPLVEGKWVDIREVYEFLKSVQMPFILQTPLRYPIIPAILVWQYQFNCGHYEDSIWPWVLFLAWAVWLSLASFWHKGGRGSN